MTQSVPKPSQPEMADVKADILEAASQLFLEGGLEALSVRSIAKKANISTFGIYSHFKGKTGILDALYEEGFAYVAEAMTFRLTALTLNSSSLPLAEITWVSPMHAPHITV